MVTVAALGLTPEQFWGQPDDIYTGMSLRELETYGEGFKQRQEIELDIMAWHAAHIMSMWAKKGHRISPAKLRGKDEAAMDPRTLQKELNELAAKQKNRKDLVTELTKLDEFDPEGDTEDMNDWMQSLVAGLAQRALGDTLDAADEEE